MTLQKKLRSLFLAVLIALLTYAAYADTVTLSTFYPSPYGSYQNLDTTGDTHLATDAGSNVGVGTTNPGQKLDVAGNLRVGIDESASRKGVFLRDSEGFAAILTSGAHLTSLAFYTDSSTAAATDAKMVIQENGNVGIGITSPDALLNVQGTPVNSGHIRFGDAVATSGTASAKLMFQGNGIDHGGLSWVPNSTVANGYFQFSADGGNDPATQSQKLMTIRRDGNVGIGVTDPDVKLEISVPTVPADGIGIKGFAITGTGTGAQSWEWYPSSNQTLLLERPGMRLAMFGNDGSFAAGGLDNNSGGGAGLFLEGGATGNFSLRNNFFVDGTTGSVGMGTVTPTAGNRLDVIGNLRVNGNIVATGTINPGPSDARFKEDLKPLNDILPKLEGLQTFSYVPSALGKNQGLPDRRQLGVLGQELEKAFPELVQSSGPEQYRSVDYSRLTVVLLEAIKELQAEVKALKKEQQPK